MPRGRRRARSSSTSRPNVTGASKIVRTYNKRPKRGGAAKRSSPTEESHLNSPKVRAQSETRQDDERIAENDAHQEEQIGAGRSYFEAHKGSIRTSNLTLASLSLSSPDQLEEALQNLENPLKREQDAMFKLFRNRFSQFSFMLSAGHCLLFYGFGSKKALLDEFAQDLTSSHAVIVVNAFNPTTSIRSILAQIATGILQLTDFPKRTIFDYVDAIREFTPGYRVAVIIHNIDGPALRSHECQTALSILSHIEFISFVASIDHANAPLLWDGSTYSKFGWVWIKTDTFVSYSAETVYSSKPLLQGGEERRIEGAVALLKSLSPRARGIFQLLAERQTSTEEGSSRRSGLLSRTTFNQLFERASEKFLAADPASLRIFLTELHTHDLLQRRIGADSAEYIWIPLQTMQLKAILLKVTVMETTR